MTIAEKRAEGMYLRDIAVELGVHPRTVRRALQRGGPPAARRAGRRRSKLEPYREQIDAWLQRGVWNAVVIFRELQAAGYSHGGRQGRGVRRTCKADVVSRSCHYAGVEIDRNHGPVDAGRGIPFLRK